MVQTLSSGGKKVAFKVVLYQFVAVVVVATITLAIKFNVGLSFFIGGMINVVPAYVFAHKAFQYAGARQARQVVRAFYLGEALKLVLTIVFFIVVFMFTTLNPKWILFGYGVALVTHWVSLVILKNNNV
ncbi:MAG TPA: F0F1 ATP synthase subunit I [Aeromonadales bacterium]|nr:F0F1 ATP synthase subunit I [Aeromonadales bacterium]